MIRYIAIVIYIIITFLPDNSFSKKNKESPVLEFDKNFFRKFSSKALIVRDSFLESKINSIIRAKGIIKTVDIKPRYGKRSRIIAIDKSIENRNLKIIYYIFLDKYRSLKGIGKDITIEFTGKFMAYTPLTSVRNMYIFDIAVDDLKKIVVGDD